MTNSAAVFLSYAHEDDRTSKGRVLALAEAVANEFSLLTGDELNLFVDRDDINWGDKWRERISIALDTSTILMPIITRDIFDVQSAGKSCPNSTGLPRPETQHDS